VIPDSESYVHINSRGLRDAEYSYKKPCGIKRIQFYGDSFTWGFGVNRDERYTSVFDSYLQKNRLESYEVMNLGTTGYGTDQEYLLLKTEGIKYSPDIIAFTYFNDLMNVANKEAYSYAKPKFILETGSLKLTNVPVPGKTRKQGTKSSTHQGLVRKMDNMLQFFRSYRFIRKRLINAALFSRPKTDSKTNDQDTLRLIGHLLLEIKTLAEKNDAIFILILLPGKNQVYGDEKITEIDYLYAFCKKKQIPVINLLPDLKEIAKIEKNLYFEIDEHLSVRGSEIIGKILFEKFVNLGLLATEITG
jgi:lysophospholipase L1-like esterase